MGLSTMRPLAMRFVVLRLAAFAIRLAQRLLSTRFALRTKGALTKGAHRTPVATHVFCANH